MPLRADLTLLRATVMPLRREVIRLPRGVMAFPLDIIALRRGVMPLRRHEITFSRGIMPLPPIVKPFPRKVIESTRAGIKILLPPPRKPHPLTSGAVRIAKPARNLPYESSKSLHAQASPNLGAWHLLLVISTLQKRSRLRTVILSLSLSQFPLLQASRGNAAHLPP